ncbi:MAG: GFA family protein [Ottowia sp.]|uniref:GFA family protein n=1 Tax=Ottowia sp. TaxID=1898956 RepID=UPI0039E617E1
MASAPTAPAALHGSCLCGGVRYAYRGAIDEISMCHCTQCQKAQGSAFVAVAPIARAHFELLAGADLLQEYRATPNKARVFCRCCGSPLYSVRDDLPDALRLRVGTLDTPITPVYRHHKFTRYKAPWFDIGDGLPREPENC